MQGAAEKGNEEEQFTGCRMGCSRPFQSLAKVRIGRGEEPGIVQVPAHDSLRRNR
jgi:hypothetical protein